MKFSPAQDLWIKRTLWLAAAYNVIGILVFSLGLQNPLLQKYDPDVFSCFGQVGIILWGLAYAASIPSYPSLPWLFLVFFVEKMAYFLHWVNWLLKNGTQLPALFAESPVTALFFSVYGAGDFLFGLFFLWLGVGALKHRA